MAGMRFDIQFSGELAEGADPCATRERLRDLFKLSPETVERLFSGRPVVIKRDLDEVAAARYRAAFSEVGAVLRLTPLTLPPGPPMVVPSPMVRPIPAEPSGLTLAPPWSEVGEAPPPGPRDIDTTHLSLVRGDNWTLEDCDHPPPPVPIPDLSHLSLAPVEPVQRRTPRDFYE
jgi:hypothetical protein